MPPPIRFYLGLGSRYSYLAAARVADIAVRHARSAEWLPLHSPELIRRAGAEPFSTRPASPQYLPAYRSRDVTRRAALYGIAFVQPDDATTDWRGIALAAVAAQELGHAEPFIRAVQAQVFGTGRPPRGPDELIEIARLIGLDGATFAAALAGPTPAARHEATITSALAAGVFGVPSFLVDGELFFGNDRLVLLEQHLATGEAMSSAIG